MPLKVFQQMRNDTCALSLSHPDNCVYTHSLTHSLTHTHTHTHTLRASLSGTFLVLTLPDLVTLLTEGALFISAQMSRTDAVSGLRKVWVLI